MSNATPNRNAIGKAILETLEDRRLMSQVHLVDGMLILQGNPHGFNRISVTPDANGTTVFARAGKAKGHFALKDIKSIRIVGGEKDDNVKIDPSIKKNAYIRL